MENPSTAEITRRYSGIMGKYRRPKTASGQCYISTTEIISGFDNHPALEVAFARHHNDPEGRYYEHGQYSNHYAVHHREENLIVDFTLNQFDPDTAWPWVGTYTEWLKILAKAWDVTPKHLTRTRGSICPDCASVGCDPAECLGQPEDY